MKIMGKLSLCLIAFILAGCLEQNLNFSIRYEAVDGLKKGASLMHETQVIGAVDEIIYTDQAEFEVQVSVAEAHQGLVTESAMFVIADDPRTTNVRIIKLIENAPSGALIQEGQVVQGSTPLTGIAKELQKQIDATLESFSTSIGRSWSKWKDHTLEQQTDALEQELDQILEALENLSNNAKEQLKNDIVPEIKQHIEQLRQRWNESGQDDSIDQIEEKMDQLDNKLEA